MLSFLISEKKERDQSSVSVMWRVQQGGSRPGGRHLALPASRTGRNEHLLSLPPVVGTLLQHPELRPLCSPCLSWHPHVDFARGASWGTVWKPALHMQPVYSHQAVAWSPWHPVLWWEGICGKDTGFLSRLLLTCPGRWRCRKAPRPQVGWLGLACWEEALEDTW